MALDTQIVPAPQSPPQSDFLKGVLVVGASYRTADLETRSALSFSGDRLSRLRTRLVAEGAESVMVLSTCNRTEVYISNLCHGPAIKILAEESGLAPGPLLSILYGHRGAEAARHLFRVACGLDSAALGETEILAQIKVAWRDSAQAMAMSGALDMLCRRAISVSKRVRTETALCRNVTSIASMAIRQASAASDGLSGKSVLLIGAGAIAERLAKEISLVGNCRCTVVNRTIVRAQALAKRYGFDSGSLADLASYTQEADVVFAAITGDVPLLHADAVGSKRLTIVDLGVPAAVGPMPSNVAAINMEMLAAACAANAKVRAGSVAEAEKIVEEELSSFLCQCTERDVAPAIRSLVQMGERVRKENVGWALAHLEGLSSDQQKIISDMALRIVRGVLQGPIVALKSPSLPPSHRMALADALRLPQPGEDD